MAKFLTGNELNSELEKIFEKAEEQIILISPYIKLHDRFISTLKSKEKNPKLKITIVFGKNQEDISRSMKKEDFDFFKKFPNIQIRYEKRLHAKYYSNESSAILTSMNLYTFSQDNNIEAGVLSKVYSIGNIASNLINNVIGEDNFDKQAENYFSRVIEQSDLLFLKTPIFESALLGLTKKFKESKVEIDTLTDFFDGKISGSKKQSDNLENKKEEKPKILKGGKGYCIRTGNQIPFNLEKPLSEEALKNWKKFNNPEFPEKFCHYSGETTLGETSFSKPILRRNWSKAKREFNL